MNTLHVLRKVTKKIVGSSQPHQFQLLIDNLELQNDAKILELGCGNGWAIFKIAQRFDKHNIEIVGIDFSSERINEANLNLSSKIYVEFINCNASKLPFESKTFDMAFSLGSFHHFNNPEEIIQETKRVLKSDGRLLIVDHCNDYFIMKLLNTLHKLKESDHNKYYSARELSSLLENNGFKNIQIKQNRSTLFWGLMLVQGEKE